MLVMHAHVCCMPTHGVEELDRKSTMNTKPMTKKLILMISIATVCGLLAPVAAQAQETPLAEQETPSAKDKKTGELEEVIVVSTRVVRDGYNSPTPTSVLGIEEIQADAPRNIADVVNQLPSVVGSDTPSITTASVSAGRAGINSLDLRSLGGNRVLVLLDGRRIASSLATGVVDLNTFPQSLISRVEVVTGGASAAWGSDAVAGVVNFTLDKEFTGWKASVQGGTTKYGDDQGYNFSLTRGMDFADNRGHLILSGEAARQGGIRRPEGTQGVPRPWYKGTKTLFNPNYTPTNGQPQLIVRDNSGYLATPGLVFTSGPLRFTYFGPDGTPGQLNTGSLVRDPGFVGGDWEYADFGGDLSAELERKSIFGHASYDVTENIEVYAEAFYVDSDVNSEGVDQFNLGNIRIRPDNAFLPADLAAILVADGQPTYNAGSTNGDLPPLTAIVTREMKRFVVGANGSFNMRGSDWLWGAYAQQSTGNIRNEALTTITSRYNKAIDAVRNANDQIVCRVNADADTTNDDTACVPYNIFGEGTASDPAKNYVLGTSWLNTELVQDVAAVSMQGDPFSNWAGPISVATGLEYRKESVTGTNDPLSNTRSYFAGNYRPTIGSYDVTEGFIETVIPLQADKLDLNAAARLTDYSTSGLVTTWKVGLTWTPIDDITFRATQSRDIRAPSLSELFAGGIAGTRTLLDPFLGNSSTTLIQVTSGNPDLTPEEADSTGIGFVVRPRFLPGFTASVDYFDIEIGDAISVINDLTIVNGCFQGITEYCDNIVRSPITGQITQVNVTPFNANTQTARGIDFEATYQTAIGDGDLTFRLFATKYLENFIDIRDPAANDIDLLGENEYRGPPDYRYLVSVAYDRGPAMVKLTGRGLSSGVYNNTYIECQTNCPTPPPGFRTIDDNSIAGAFYLDLSLSYQVKDTTTFFLTVANLLDQDPASVPPSQSIGNAPRGVNPAMYDVTGTVYRAGVRFEWD